MSAGLTVEGRVDPTHLSAIEARSPLPGETVVVDARTAGTAIAKALRDAGTLTVEATIVGPMLSVRHRFVGVDGEWPASAFRIPEKVRDLVGVLLARDGRAWLVPKGAPPTEVATTVTRPVAKHFAESASGAANFFSDLESEPVYGSFSLADQKDGTHRIVGVGWGSDCTAGQLAAANLALDEVAPNAPPLIP